jgi:hypothetical protein
MSVGRLAPTVWPDPSRPRSEIDLGRDLAAAYRLNTHFGIDDLVFTHLSARAGDEFLVNPYGMLFEEITASSLVVVDADGLATWNSSWPVNPAGFVICSATHLGRPYAVCVIHAHTHTLAGMAVAARQGWLLPLNQLSIELHGLVAEYDYEGIAADDDLDKPERLLSDQEFHGAAQPWPADSRTQVGRGHSTGCTAQSCRLQGLAQSTGVPLPLPPVSIIVRTVVQFSSERAG